MVRGRHKACDASRPRLSKAAISAGVSISRMMRGSNSPWPEYMGWPPRIGASDTIARAVKSTCARRGLPLARKLTSASRCARAPACHAKACALSGWRRLIRANSTSSPCACFKSIAACAYSAPLNPSQGDMISTCGADFLSEMDCSNAQPKTMMNSTVSGSDRFLKMAIIVPPFKTV